MTVLMACTNHHADELYPQPASICTSDTATTISFSRHIQPLLQQHCAIAGCHTSVAMAGNLNLEAAVAYVNLWDTRSGYLDTANPAGSLLYSQMISISNPMPPTGRLDSCNTKIVLKWIAQKALNN